MTAHDYAGCSDPTCRLCEGYGEGWAHGKAKMGEEIMAVAGRRHASDCGCVPCRVIREVLRRRGWRGTRRR